jgi:hypothetical protein
MDLCTNNYLLNYRNVTGRAYKETNARFGRNMFSAIQKHACKTNKDLSSYGDNLALMKSILILRNGGEKKEKLDQQYSDGTVISLTKRNCISSFMLRYIYFYETCRCVAGYGSYLYLLIFVFCLG